MNSSPTPTARPASVQAGPAPRLLRSATARRIAAAGAALPFVLALTAAFLPAGPVPVLMRAASLLLFLVLVLVLRAATQWNSAKLRTLDERERGEHVTVVRAAYVLAVPLFVTLALVGMLDRLGVAPDLTSENWVSLLAGALFTYLLLPYAVLAWRLVDEPSEA